MTSKKIIKKSTNLPITQEGQVLSAIPTPPIKLASIEEIRREMARVYRDARTATTDTADASRLVYILTSIAKMIEIGQFEQRLAEIERRL
jgi:hypothetical protein